MNKRATSFPRDSAGGITLLDADPGRFCYRMWSNVSVSVWADQATRADAHRVVAISDRIVREYPEGHSSVLFILDGAPAPTPEAAAIFKKLYDPANSRISCMGIVLEGAGFWASVMRSTFTRLRVAAGGSLNMRAYESIEELVNWFPNEHAQRTGVRLDPGQLMAALRAIRALETKGA
jgi:hypothetical protein